MIQEADLAGGQLLVHAEIDAISRLTLYATDGKAPARAGSADAGHRYFDVRRNDSDSVYYGFTSFLYAARIYQYDVRQGEHPNGVRAAGALRPDPYDTQEVFYPSKDGTRVPLFIVARKGVKLDGGNATVLYGYGGFDITITPTFNPMLPVWLELGGIYAVANMRGGGTYGEKWHEGGMLSHKQNVFDDFAWAAKYLIAQRYTSARTPRHPRVLERGPAHGRLDHAASRALRRCLHRAWRARHAALPGFLGRRALGSRVWHLGRCARLQMALRLLAVAQHPRRHLLSANADHDLMG